MMKPTDIQLVDLFAQQGDQAAFEQLVDRYVDVAYSAAITCLGRDDLARDACQLTFVELARKAAGLSANVKLGGWVYTTSRNISRKIQRGELRRLKREQEYADQMKLQTSPEEDWTRLAPEIHEALERLKSADRDSIILRYFQHKSLSETGTALGLSPDAARMRLNRALERLNKQLAHKGITSTAAALAAALPAHAALTAPAGLAKIISATALAKIGATTLGLSTLTGAGIMSTKTLIISASVAATALIGGTVYLTNQNKTTEKPAMPVVAASEIPAEKTAQEKPAEVVALESSSPVASAADEKIVIGAVAGTFDSSAVISPEQLKEAEQILDLINILVSMGESAGVDLNTVMGENTDNLVKKLSLRLGLTAEQELVFQEVLEENNKAVAGGLDPQAVIEGLLGIDRKKAAEYLALSMLDEQTMADPELATYFESMQQDVASDLGIDIEALKGEQPVPAWDKNDAVLAKLLDQLTPRQQNELLTYTEEQTLRAEERRAYERSSQIANQLGLNEEDRASLYDYLYENPDATNKDIKENLSPELHELME